MSSFDKDLSAAVSKYENTYIPVLNKFVVPTAVPTEISKLIEYEKTYTQKLRELQSCSVSPMKFDPLDEINKKFDRLEQDEAARKQQIEQQAEITKKERQAAHEAEVASAQQYNSDLLIPIRSKHQDLLQYKDELKRVFDYYGITPLDVKLSDNLTLKEFNTLIDSSIGICQKYMRKDSSLFSKALTPLRDNTNLGFTLGYCALGLVLAYICLPLAAVPVFYFYCKSTHNMYNDIERLRIASVLMSQIDYQRFVSEDEMRTISDIDYTDIESSTKEALSTLKDYSIERDAAIAELDGARNDIQKICTDATTKVKGAYADRTKALQDFVMKVTEAKNKFMSEVKKFPAEQNLHLTLDRNFTLSRVNEVIDVKTPLPAQNIVFDSSDRSKAISLLKLYLSNALLSVRVKNLYVDLIDPMNLCAEFSEFLVPETKEYIHVNPKNFDEVVKSYREYAQANVFKTKDKSVDDFNTDAEERELVPIDYRLCIMVSGFEKQLEGDNGKLFEEFFRTSFKYGVWMWMLDTRKREGCYWVDGSVAQGVPIQYTQELGEQATNIYTTALAKFKDRGIDYVKKFANKYIPRDKWWTWDTIKSIEMNIGLENGDPTRGFPMLMGDANVHALLGGATGAGKSAAINEMLISLITKYPPSELQLVYVDFKNVEAAKFTCGYEPKENRWHTADEDSQLKKEGKFYTRLSRIPHLRIISGTTDGEYALSVFEFLMEEMARRQKVINMFGVTKLQEARERILAKYNEEHNGDPKKGTWHEMRQNWDWYKKNIIDEYGMEFPRLLIVFDEFQVMFNPEFVEPKIIDQINGKITAITKLARAMGCHFWFTSQSMKGTMSADTMGNFSLRMALRCSSEVSNELLGNGASGTIKAKFGFMYSNDSAGQNKDANKFWRLPFLDEKDMPGFIDQMYPMMEEMHESHNMAEFYDEKILVPSVVMNDWFVNYPEAFADPSTFILGERAAFSTNKAPLAITLQDDDGENVLIAAFDRQDMLNMTLTMIDNIKQHSENCDIIINSMDKDSYTLLDIENIADPRFVSLASPKQDPEQLLDALGQMISMRKEKGGPYRQLFIVLVQWEKAPGIGVDKNYKLEDKFKAVMRDGPAVGVHFILCMREKGEMGRFVATSCKHHLGGLMMSDQSGFFMNTTKVEKLPSADKDAGLFALYEFGTTLVKFRIYQHVFTAQLKSREIRI